VHFYTFRPHTPTVRKNGHRRCRAVVEPTSHGLRRGRGCAARHRFAISTSGDHRVAAAEGASRGENRPFGLSRANEWLPMPTAVSPIGNMRSRAVWTYRSASGLGGSRAERRRSRRQGMRVGARAAVSCDAFDRFGRMATSRSQDSDRSRRHACVSSTGPRVGYFFASRPALPAATLLRCFYLLPRVEIAFSKT